MRFWQMTLAPFHYVQSETPPQGAYWQEVPERPDFTYDWDGKQWVKNVDKEIKPIPTLDDIIAILSVDQKAQLQINLATKAAQPKGT